MTRSLHCSGYSGSPEWSYFFFFFFKSLLYMLKAGSTKNILLFVLYWTCPNMFFHTFNSKTLLKCHASCFFAYKLDRLRRVYKHN
ncbi:hypothetical protein NC653_031061 [Populus alba x Populus x berolinensis]|uniref:Uncharacterized protein n=1 Tax=Populus alba x Populus x berolinensis TaxID=444605 RepID=A0AAD6LXV7_9ROSI|nr:hypothetical protein NC653_031061 [Populus alba x Populus x berolinensis]